MSRPQSVKGPFKRYPFASICVAIFVVLLVGLFFRNGTLSEAKAALAEKESAGERSEKNVRNGAGLGKQLEILQSSMAKLEAKLIRVGDVGPNQQYFYELETAAGVKLSVLRTLGAVKTKRKGAVYQPVGYNVVVEGRFPQVLDFLHGLERGGRNYRFVDLKLNRIGQEQPTGEKGASVVLTLNLELLASS